MTPSSITDLSLHLSLSSPSESGKNDSYHLKTTYNAPGTSHACHCYSSLVRICIMPMIRVTK